MKKNKPNISLANLSELRLSGISLAMRKGLNELFRTNRGQKPAESTPDAARNYEDMISVIICTAGRQELVTPAVLSVINQDFDDKKFEVIVVNNSTAAFPEQLLPESVQLVNEPVAGLSRARNRGAKAAKGKILLYIDDDARAHDALLNSMYSAFEEHPQTAIVGGQIFLKVPSPAPSIFLEGRESLWSGYTVSYEKFREVHMQYEFPYGACFAIRHAALDSLGGFPEGYGRCGNNFAGGEETALCFAALRAKMKLGIEPRAAVTHCVSRDRFCEEHVRRTIREGIITTYRLYLDGYAPSGWTEAYADERINIIKSELERLAARNRELEAFYKRCELDAFCELKSIMQNITPHTQ